MTKRATSSPLTEPSSPSRSSRPSTNPEPTATPGDAASIAASKTTHITALTSEPPYGIINAVGQQPSIDQKARTISQDVRAGLSSLYGPRLHGLYLYGSYARGQESDDSDIDFLVLLDEIEDVGEELERMSELGSRLSLAFDVTITFFPLSVSEFQNLRTPFLLNVRREAVEV